MIQPQKDSATDVCCRWATRIGPLIACLGIIAAIVAVVYTAPGPSPPSGGVNVNFRNNGTQQTQHSGFRVQVANGPQVVPIDIEMKFLAIYLWTDYNTTSFKRVNDDIAPLVWQNPQCASIPDNNCNTNDVSDYFNFTQNLAAINAEINSQNRSIPVGHYHYIQMTMCKHNLTSTGTAVAGTDPNFRFLAARMNHTFAMVSNNCGIWSTRADPPITVTEGSTVQVHLDFSLEGICTETQCSAPGMAHQPPHTIDGQTYACVACDVPAFRISLA